MDIDVSPANVANTVFDASTLGGPDVLVGALAAEQWHALPPWQEFSVTVPTPTAECDGIAI